MINFVQPANVVGVPAPRDLKSGEGFVLGKLFGVATVDTKSGGVVQAMIEGGVELLRTAGLTLNEGDAAHFDETTQMLVAAGAVRIGICYASVSPDNAAASWVKLIPSAA